MQANRKGRVTAFPKKSLAAVAALFWHLTMRLFIVKVKEEIE